MEEQSQIIFLLELSSLTIKIRTLLLLVSFEGKGYTDNITGRASSYTRERVPGTLEIRKWT